MSGRIVSHNSSRMRLPPVGCISQTEDGVGPRNLAHFLQTSDFQAAIENSNGGRIAQIVLGADGSWCRALEVSTCGRDAAAALPDGGVGGEALIG
jgi:hypothetical protein